MIEHAQGERLEYDGIGERTLDGEDGGAGEVQLTLAIAADRSREPVVLEVSDRRRIDDVLVSEEPQLVVTEAEVAQETEQAAGAGDDTEAAAPDRRRENSSKTLGRNAVPSRREAASIVSS